MVYQLGTDIFVSHLLPLLDTSSLFSLRLTSRDLRDLVEQSSHWEHAYRTDFSDDQHLAYGKSWFERYMRRTRASLFVWDPENVHELAQFRLQRDLQTKTENALAFRNEIAFRKMAGITTTGCVLIDDRICQLSLPVPDNNMNSAKLIVTDEATVRPYKSVGGNSSFVWALDKSGFVHGLHVGFWRPPYRIEFGFERQNPILSMAGLVVRNKGIIHVSGMGLVAFKASEELIYNQRNAARLGDEQPDHDVDWHVLPGTEPGNRDTEKITAYAAGFEYVVYITDDGEPYFYDVPSDVKRVPEVKPLLLDEAIALIPEGSTIVKVRAHIGSFALITDNGELIYYSNWDSAMHPMAPELIATEGKVRDITLSSFDPLVFTDDGAIFIHNNGHEWTTTTDGIPESLRKNIMRLHRGQSCLVAITVPPEEPIKNTEVFTHTVQVPN